SAATPGLEILLGSNVGFETRASTAPVVGSSTTTAPSLLAPGVEASASVAASWRTGSTVGVTLSGSDGGVSKSSWLKFCGLWACVLRYWLYSYSMPEVP